MPRRPAAETDTKQQPDAFTAKVNDLDFDPWGTEEEDSSARRRDPLRRPVGQRLPEAEDEPPEL